MRHEYICRLRCENPRMTLQAIADRADCSKQYVWQTLSSESLPTGAAKSPPRYCQRCGIKLGYFQHDLCTSCRHDQCHIKLVCPQCGITFERGAHWVRAQRKHYQHIFCSRHCNSRWRGLHWGFKRKTHCKRGHLLEGNNLYWRGSRRECKACRKVRQEEYRKRLLSLNDKSYSSHKSESSDN